MAGQALRSSAMSTLQHSASNELFHSADGYASVLNAAAQRARKNPLDTTAAGFDLSSPTFPTLLAVVVTGSTA